MDLHLSQFAERLQHEGGGGVGDFAVLPIPLSAGFRVCSSSTVRSIPLKQTPQIGGVRGESGVQTRLSRSEIEKHDAGKYPSM
jgi:hypothetical protein